MAATSKGKKRVTFKLNAKKTDKVFVAGSFNDWDATAKSLKYDAKKKQHSVTMYLPTGEHQYKFVLNGAWCVDPECENWELNDLGSMNSVVEVA